MGYLNYNYNLFKDTDKFNDVIIEQVSYDSFKRIFVLHLKDDAKIVLLDDMSFEYYSYLRISSGMYLTNKDVDSIKSFKDFVNWFESNLTFYVLHQSNKNRYSYFMRFVYGNINKLYCLDQNKNDCEKIDYYELVNNFGANKKIVFETKDKHKFKDKIITMSIFQ